jgi:hypothetical protein
MGNLYDAVQQIDAIIAKKGVDPFKTKGAISMRTGFLLSFIGPEDPDDDAKVEQLRQVVLEVLGEHLGG